MAVNVVLRVTGNGLVEAGKRERFGDEPEMAREKPERGKERQIAMPILSRSYSPKSSSPVGRLVGIPGRCLVSWTHDLNSLTNK